MKRSPRVEWCDNATPYLGVVYSEEEVREALSEYDEITWTQASNSEICDLLMDENIVSVYGGGSESGRRALGNRSILADPRNPNMKDIVNEKVKHRQWFRPFAPSIMREEVSNWFTRDVNSPYMGFVLQFKKEKQDLVLWFTLMEVPDFKQLPKMIMSGIIIFSVNGMKSLVSQLS